MTSVKKLIRATYLLGLIPLSVGLLIFFTWWIGKAWFLVTIQRLEVYCFFWILISIPIGLAGLTTAVIYLVKTFKTNLAKGLIGLLCVLINIPVLIWVVNTQSDIEKRAYVKIDNQSESDFRELTIGNSTSKQQFHSLDKDDSKIKYFYPKYLNGEFDSVPIVDQVILTIKTDKEEKTIYVPAIYQGENAKITVDREFNIKVDEQH